MSNTSVSEAAGTLSYSDGGILSALIVNLSVAFVLLAIFSLLQTRESFKPVFSPRSIHGNAATNMALPEPKTLPSPPKGLFGWMSAAYHVSDDEILARSGLRSLLLLKFQMSIIKLLLVVSVLSTCIILPINLSGDYNRQIAEIERTHYESGFYDWTTNNMIAQDARLWAHFIILCVISFAAYFLLFRSVKDFHQLRRAFRARVHNSDSVVSKTVFIANLPPELRNPRILLEHIQKTSFPDSVSEVVINLDVPILQNLQEKRRSVRESLRNVSSRQEERGEKVFFKSCFSTMCCECCCCGERVDAGDYYKQKLETINTQMYEERKREDHPTTSHAFVTFYEDQVAKQFVQNMSLKFDETVILFDPLKHGPNDTIFFRNRARGAIHKVMTKALKTRLINENGSTMNSTNSLHPDTAATATAPSLTHAFPPTCWEVQAAPVPEDLIWENFSMSTEERSLRKVLYFFLKWTWAIFYSVPISALANAGSLFVADIGLPEWAFGIVSSFLPSLIAILLQALLPYLLQYMLEKTGMLTRSEVHLAVMEDFFTFSVVSTVVLPTIFIANFQTFYARFTTIYLSPFNQVLEIFSQITSPTTTFWISYVLQSAFTSTCLALLRVLPLIVRFGARRFAVTKKDFVWADVVSNWPCFFYLVYGDSLLLLTITLFFSLTMPVITPLGLLYFLLKHHVERYLVCYVYPTPLDTGKGGDMYASALRRFCIIVACFQLGACATFVGKQCVPQAVLSVLLCVVTIYAFKAVRERLDRTFKADLWIADLGDEYNSVSKIPREVMKEMYKDAYRHPAFSTREDLLTHLAMLENPEDLIMTEAGILTTAPRKQTTADTATLLPVKHLSADLEMTESPVVLRKKSSGYTEMKEPESVVVE